MLVILPNISVIIPAFNEQGFIGECLQSVLRGSYPKEKLELLVIDGASTDGTIAEITDLQARNPQVKIFNNPNRIVPSAMNIGLSEASNEIIVWLGAHAIYDKDYLLNSVQVLMEENCASSGGVISPIAKTHTGKAIALATSHVFGIGNAKYRYAKSRQQVDTVFGGCWRKADLLKIGGFNEKWVRNQDYELNIRLREQVGPIILDPSIKCEYYCRESINALAHQYYGYGKWRFATFQEHPSTFSLRQAAPLLLLIGLLFSIGLVLVSSPLYKLVPGVYLLVSGLISALLAIKARKLSYLILLPIIFATLHLCWAVGFMAGTISNLFRKNTGMNQARK